jgi:hypothetical protein
MHRGYRPYYIRYLLISLDLLEDLFERYYLNFLISIIFYFPSIGRLKQSF